MVRLLNIERETILEPVPRDALQSEAPPIDINALASYPGSQGGEAAEAFQLEEAAKEEPPALERAIRVNAALGRSMDKDRWSYYFPLSKIDDF